MKYWEVKSGNSVIYSATKKAEAIKVWEQGNYVLIEVKVIII